MTDLHVLRTPLLLTDYDRLAAQCQDWARSGRCVAAEFANTQIVTLRRHEPAFRELTSRFDHFVPDGMPLIWCLNRAGARLRDRVYGPTFMRRFLSNAPSGLTHYLLGGSAECGSRIRQMFQGINPGVKIVGSYHGNCGRDGFLEGADDRRVLDEIDKLAPDIIWVGFGTPKQQAWVHQHKGLIRRGTILTVGFAFDVNAGLKRDAPQWMQRLGLTWLFRLGSEPGRLGPRYFRYNLLFLYYLLIDGLRGRAWGKDGNLE